MEQASAPAILTIEELLSGKVDQFAQSPRKSLGLRVGELKVHALDMGAGVNQSLLAVSYPALDRADWARLTISSMAVRGEPASVRTSNERQ